MPIDRDLNNHDNPESTLSGVGVQPNGPETRQNPSCSQHRPSQNDWGGFAGSDPVYGFRDSRVDCSKGLLNEKRGRSYLFAGKIVLPPFSFLAGAEVMIEIFMRVSRQSRRSQKAAR